MKKLVAVTTTILIILIAVLGLMVVKGSTGTDEDSIVGSEGKLVRKF
mgnify:CR=1 FL=1